MSDGGPAGRRVVYFVTSALSLAFLRDQVGHLVDSGHEVVVAASVPDGTKPPFVAGVEIVDVGFAREPSLRDDLRAMVRVIRLLRRVRPDATIVATPKAALLGTVAAWSIRVPVRVHLVWGLRSETLSGPRRWIVSFFERLATAASTHVLFNSPSLLEAARKCGSVGRRSGELIGGGSGNCVCMERFDDLPERTACRESFGLPSNTVVVGFVGRLTTDKGVVDLVEAFDLCRDAHLLLVGDYEDGDPIPEDARARIERAEHVTHIGWQDDVRSVYGAIDVLAFASYREGLPNVPLEAQRSGRPVVAYAATGTVDAVRPEYGGILVPVGDVEGLARGLQSLIDDGARRTTAGREAQRFAREGFDPQRCWDQLVAIIEGGRPVRRAR